MGRFKLLLAYFMGILLALSVTQAFIDARIEASLYVGTSGKSGTYSIFIEIEDKTLYLLQDGKRIKEYRIASGKSGLPSPLGTWRIVEKGDWGEGFGGRWMGLDVPWGKYGIHGTLDSGSIGSAASHGCIRMFKDDVAELYNLVPIGTVVTIVNGQFGPFGRGFDEINPGDRGADVLAIQQRLKQLGYYGGPLDGIYEDGLKKAVHQFQRANGLKAQNTINRETWLKMGFREFE
ncbi:MAG: L,D-transpeptidase family protein [Bacillota bacterium]